MVPPSSRSLTTCAACASTCAASVSALLDVVTSGGEDELVTLDPFSRCFNLLAAEQQVVKTQSRIAAIPMIINTGGSIRGRSNTIATACHSAALACSDSRDSEGSGT
eukprot:scaffold48431_cov64-Phaeocystis_antarctica.AAC.2